MLRFFFILLFSVALSACSSTNKDSAVEEKETPEEEEVVITGTRIPRQDLTSKSPHHVIIDALTLLRTNRALDLMEGADSPPEICSEISCLSVGRVAPISPEETFTPKYSYYLYYWPFERDEQTEDGKVAWHVEIDIKRSLEFVGKRFSHVEVPVSEIIKIENSGENKLGRPFRPGYVHVKAKRPDGNYILIGAENMRTLKEEEDIYLAFMTSQEITVSEIIGFMGVTKRTRKGVVFEVLRYENFVTLRNGTDEPEGVWFVEPNPNVTILSENFGHFVENNGQAKWWIPLEPGEEKQLFYTAEVPRP